MIVMDTSAAVGIACDTEKGRALRSLMLPNETVVAPSWFQAEVRNVLWKYVHTGIMDKEEAIERVRKCEALVTDFASVEEYKDEAFNEAINHGHSFYDMLFLCLTRRNGATLFTLDQRLMEVCRQAKVNCIEEMDLTAIEPLP